MKLAAVLVALLLLADAGRPEAAILYFTNVREVHIAQSDRQNYFVVDSELWAHARRDLGDLRLYDGQAPLQSAVAEQQAAVSSEEIEAKIINLGNVSGRTEFDLDAGNISEYDRIRLRLDAHDFVATASVSGGAAAGKASDVELPPSTLYDFSKEHLGSNSQLKLPTSSFRFLHIRLSPGIRPQQVTGASIYSLREQQASWTEAGSCAAPVEKPRNTAITCEILPGMPLNRIVFQVEPAQVNFRRSISVEDAQGVQIARGEISRVRVNRAVTLVTNEIMLVTVAADTTKNSGLIKLDIDNGDNPSLNGLSTKLFSSERRVYFEPHGKTLLSLYYGDEKLPAPVYDYARFLRKDDSAAVALLGAGSHNPQCTGRPDDRPWSERHKAVLWGAMLLAVFTLAVLALRGLRNAPPQSPAN